MELVEVTERLLKMSGQLDLLQDYILMKFGKQKSYYVNFLPSLRGTLDFERFVSDRRFGKVKPVLNLSYDKSKFSKKKQKSNNNSRQNEANLNTTTLLNPNEFSSTFNKEAEETVNFIDEDDGEESSTNESEKQEHIEQALDNCSDDDWTESIKTPSKRKRGIWKRHGCVVPGCSNELRKVYSTNLSWHAFPTKHILKLQRKQWIDEIRNAKNNPIWEPKTTDRICSRHFENKCYLPSTDKGILFPSAKPTQYLLTESPKGDSNNATTVSVYTDEANPTTSKRCTGDIDKEEQQQINSNSSITQEDEIVNINQAESHANEVAVFVKIKRRSLADDNVPRTGGRSMKGNGREGVRNRRMRLIGSLKCDICNVVFTSSSAKSRHKRRDHPINSSEDTNS